MGGVRRASVVRRVCCASALVLALASCGSRTGLAEVDRISTRADAGERADGGVDGGVVDAGPVLPLVERRVPFRIEPARLLDVAASDDGGFLVLYVVNAIFGTEGSEVRAQRFDAEGERLGEAILVYASDRFGPSGQATFLDDGGFAIAFPTVRGGITRLDYDVRVRQFTRTGEDTGLELEQRNEWRPSIVGLRGGGFVLTTQRWEDDVSAFPLIERRFTRDGVEAGESEHARGCGRLHVVGGGYGVGCGETFHRFGADGTAVGVPRTVEPFEDDGGIEALAHWPDARMLVVSEGRARRLEANGAPMGDWMELGSDPVARPRQLELARSGCGIRRCRFTALWLDDESGEERPRMRELDERGEPVGEALELGPAAGFMGPRVFYENVDVAGARYGQAVVAWTAMDRPEAGGGITLSVEGVLIVRN